MIILHWIRTVLLGAKNGLQPQLARSDGDASVMARTAGVIRQSEVQAVCRGAFKGGAKHVTVEATLGNGAKLKVTAQSEDPSIMRQAGEEDGASAEAALARWRRTKK